jgi:hypothetical protein
MTAAVASSTNTAIPLSALQYVVVSGSVADESDSDDTQEYRGPMVIRDDRPYLIQDGLYLGSCLAEEGKVHLKKAGVTHILQVIDYHLACAVVLIRLAWSWATAADAARLTGMVSSASQCHIGTQNYETHFHIKCKLRGLYCMHMQGDLPCCRPLFCLLTEILLQVADGLWKTHPSEFEYLQIHVEDKPTTDLVAHFAKCFDFIDKAIASNGKAPAKCFLLSMHVAGIRQITIFHHFAGIVFVHCVAGISRSASVCIGYLMWKHRVSYQQAYKVVKDSRPWINPNYGFADQLNEFERLNFDLYQWRAWRHKVKEQPGTVVEVIAM